ncbi:MAG: MFS transporter [Chloroflexi bacterium]|nr:MFS transporter [Chloroflexota bacterium]
MRSLGLLGRNRDFALVWLGGLISLAGDWALLIALPVYAFEVTGSPVSTSLMLAARIVPRLLVGPVAGVYVDRWDRRKTLVIANLILAASLLPLLTAQGADSLWLVYLVAAAQAGVSQFVTPAENALLPRLVPNDELLAANSLNALNNNIARLIGPPIGGFLIGLTGLAGVAVVDAASFLAAALLVSVTTGDTRPQTSEQPTRATSAIGAVWHEWLSGVRVMLGSRTLSVLLAFTFITALGEGIMGALMVPFVIEVLASDELGVSWVVAAQAVGGLLGSLALAWCSPAWRPARMIGGGAIGLAIMDWLTFNYSVVIPGLWPALLFMGIVGLPIAALQVGLSTLGQLATGDEYRGRVMGGLMAAASLSSLVGTGLAGLLAGWLGVVALLNIQGLGYFLAGILVLMMIPSRSPDPEVAATAS